MLWLLLTVRQDKTRRRMANTNLIITLGKVIIAAAWADGHVSHEEVNSLKDLLFRLPQLNATQWAELEMYIDSPVDDAERDRLTNELLRAVNSKADRDLALEALDEMLHADGEITEEEKAVFEEIKADIAAQDVSLFGAVKRLVSGPVQRRTTAVHDAPNREEYFDDFVRNRVYYAVQQRLGRAGQDLHIDDDKLRKLSLAAGVMARVARVRNGIEDSELKLIESSLEKRWHISEDEANFIAAAAASDETRNLDPFRTAREFFEVCTQEERIAFAEVLFQVAAADGMATRDEIREIRTISNTLLLSHEQFINAKLTIPVDQREE